MSDTFYHNLPNGVQIVHRKTTSPVVYVGIMVGAGTRHELPNENGMAHYIEHCVFKGTEHYTARHIINHIEGIGGEINAYSFSILMRMFHFICFCVLSCFCLSGFREEILNKRRC